MQLKKIRGATLVEIILVLVIAGAIIGMALKQYRSMRMDADVEQAQYIVDQLFGAAADFYQANCRIPINPATGAFDPIGPGVLDPAYNPPPTNPYPVTVANLINNGFLATPLPLNRLINDAGLNNGYIVQFNQSPPANRVVNGNVVGRIIVWRVQVAIEMRANVSPALRARLHPDCFSTLAGTTVLPCVAGGPIPMTGVIYAVWERLPSFAVPDADPNQWITNAQTRSFNQLYTNNSVSYDPDAVDLQNYLCGN